MVGNVSREKNSYQKVSYSQCGEDLIVSHLFKMFKIDKPSYLDIGAGHPCDGNNTYLFYLSSGSGILVDADPHNYKLLDRERSNDRVYNCAVVGNTSKYPGGFVKLQLTSVRTLSTINKNLLPGYKNRGYKVVGTVDVQVFPINELMETFMRCPDFVSIDIEGAEVEVLSELDFDKYKPLIFCIETLDFATQQKNKNLIELMDRRGYLLYADTMVNSIFVNKERYGARLSC